MATIRPSAGLIANWMFEPPVSTPTRRMIRRAASRMRWYSLSVSVSAGATVMLSPVCTPIGSMFSIEQMTTKLSAQSRMTSSSNSFQPMTDSSTRISWTGLIDRPRCAISRNSSTLYAMPPPTPPSVKEGRMMLGYPRRPAASSACAIVRAYCALRHLDANRAHRVLELQPILGDLDRVNRRADELHAVPLEDAALAELHGEVERRLPAHRRQDARPAARAR